MNNQIEEMAKVLKGMDRWDEARYGFYESYARALYNAGYRKQSEGEWKKMKAGNGWDYWDELTCSECGVTFEDKYGNIPKKFCPNCGARMKGGE